MSKYPCETCLNWLIRNEFLDPNTRELTDKGIKEFHKTNFSGSVCYQMAEELVLPTWVLRNTSP